MELSKRMHQSVRNIIVYILKWMMGKNKLISDVICDERLSKLILHDKDFLEKMKNCNLLFRGIVGDDRCVSKLMLDDEFVGKVVDTAQLLDRIVMHKDFIGRVHAHGGMFRGIVGDDRCVSRLMLDDEFVGKVTQKDDFLQKIVLNNNSYEKVFETVEFTESWREIRKVVNTEKINVFVPCNFTRDQLRKKDTLKANRILDMICEGDELVLANGSLKFPERSALWILINEILINEDYYFKTDTDSPRILDCGTHFGLAIYYFKILFPKSRITCFEPVPELRELALENIKKNGYSDVEILPYALSDKNKKATFLISKSDSMAGSLTTRRRIAGDEIKEILVECHKLSDYLKEPVHYLKMDIEGSEDIVLKEAESLLGNVQHIFCEYHHNLGLDTGRLGEIISLLDNAGFDVHVSKSWSSHYYTSIRPMHHAKNPYSAVLWAKNRNWKY